jgi:hypothetical protein
MLIISNNKWINHENIETNDKANCKYIIEKNKLFTNDRIQLDSQFFTVLSSEKINNQLKSSIINNFIEIPVNSFKKDSVKVYIHFTYGKGMGYDEMSYVLKKNKDRCIWVLISENITVE